MDSLKSVLVLGTGETLKRATLSELAPPKPTRSNSVKSNVSSVNERDTVIVEVDTPTLLPTNEELLSSGGGLVKLPAEQGPEVVMGANVVEERGPAAIQTERTLEMPNSSNKTDGQQVMNNVTDGDHQLLGDEAQPTQTSTLPDINAQPCNSVSSSANDNAALPNTLSDQQGLLESTETKSKPCTEEQDGGSGGGGYDYVFEAARSLGNVCSNSRPQSMSSTWRVHTHTHSFDKGCGGTDKDYSTKASRLSGRVSTTFRPVP